MYVEKSIKQNLFNVLIMFFFDNDDDDDNLF